MIRANTGSVITDMKNAHPGSDFAIMKFIRGAMRKKIPVSTTASPYESIAIRHSSGDPLPTRVRYFDLRPKSIFPRNWGVSSHVFI